MTDKHQLKSDNSAVDPATIRGGELYHQISQCQDVIIVTEDMMLFLKLMNMELVVSLVPMSYVAMCSTEDVGHQIEQSVLNVGHLLVNHTYIQSTINIVQHIGYGY